MIKSKYFRKPDISTDYSHRHPQDVDSPRSKRWIVRRNDEDDNSLEDYMSWWDKCRIRRKVKRSVSKMRAVSLMA
jgi:hypothetical protein